MTLSASAVSRRTKASTLSVTILIVALAISPMAAQLSHERPFKKTMISAISAA